MKILRARDYRMMPWKNGGGSTAEIAIEPADAEMARSDFVWRLSAAVIEESGPFSKFHGYRRILWAWKGEGLSLNGKAVERDRGFEFSGDEAVEATVGETPVFDLGFIYRPEKIAVEWGLFDFSRPERKRLETGEGTQIFFCAAGKVEIDGVNISEGDTAMGATSGTTRLTVTAAARLIWIRVRGRT